MWNDFFRPLLKTASPIISISVEAKTKNPQLAQITLNVLKWLTVGRVLN